MAQNQYSAADNFNFDNIPDPTAEELAAPAAHSAREVGGAAHGQSAQVARLEAELGEDAAPAVDAQEELPAADTQADAAGPQTEEREDGAEAEAPETPPPLPAWDAAAWDAADFDKPERLAEVPEAYRPVVEKLAAAAGARVIVCEEGYTRRLNEAGARSERETALEREVAVMRWRDFTREVPQGDKLLALAKRGDPAAKAAVKEFGDLANKVGFHDAWDITAKRHKAVVGKLTPTPAPVAPAAPAAAAPAAPPPPPAVAPPARPPAAPVQPPTRMAPRVAPPPPVQQRAAVRAPAQDDDALLTAGWDEFKRGR